MPLVTGPLLPGGAIIDVLVGVSGPRRALLEKHSFPVPHPVAVRVLIDTGSSHTGFAPRVFNELGISPVGTMHILTPSTLPHAPHECDLFDATLSLVANGAAHPFGGRRVVSADCWMESEGIEGLIGRDILDRCTFMYFGLEKAFSLGFV